MIAAPSEVHVTLRIDGAKAMKAEDWFGGEELEKENAGSLRIRLRVPAGDWLLNTLLSFGPGIEILEPRSLRDALAGMAGEIADVNCTRNNRQSGLRKIDRRGKS
jgi:predicted DNA-binding transcriptional regulator YafY